MITCAFVAVFWSHALANEFLAEHATPLEADRIFYRWQSTESGEGLSRLGTLNAATNAHFMSLGKGINAGPGIYFAGTPLSSSEYLPNTGGNLIEVKIPRGTPVLDLMDQATLKRLKDAGVSLESLHDGLHSEDGLILRYSNDWYVGKNLTDRAHFQMYPSPEQPKEDVLLTWRRANVQHASKVAQQVTRQVEARRPGFVRENFLPGSFETPFLNTLTPDELVGVIDKHLTENSEHMALVNLLKFLTKQSDASQKIQRESPAAFNRVAQVLVAYFQEHLSILDEPEVHIITNLALRASDNLITRRRRVMDLLDHAFANHELQRDYSAMARIVSPLLAATELNEIETARVTKALQVLTRQSHLHSDDGRELQIMASAARIQDPSLVREIEALTNRWDLIRRAADSERNFDVLQALRGHENIASFRRTVRLLSAEIQSTTLHDAVGHWVAMNPEEYLGLIKGPEDFNDAVVLVDTYRLPIFERTYAAAVNGDDTLRLRFLETCFAKRDCRRQLDERLTKDHGLIFKNFERPDALASALHDLNVDFPKEAKRFAQLALRGITDRNAIQSFRAAVSPPMNPLDIRAEADRRIGAFDRLRRYRQSADRCLTLVDEAER